MMIAVAPLAIPIIADSSAYTLLTLTHSKSAMLGILTLPHRQRGMASLQSACIHTGLRNRQIALMHCDHVVDLRLLQSQWAALVSDHIILSTQPPPVIAAFAPRLFPQAPAHAQSAIAQYLSSAWPHVLAALCASMTTPAEKVEAAAAEEHERRMSSSMGRSMSRSLSTKLPQVNSSGLQSICVCSCAHCRLDPLT